MKVTPEFVVSFETDLNGIATGNWQRVVQNLYWDRIMKTRPASGKREILTWLLETAKIYARGDGGNARFDDLIAATTSYEIAAFGDGLRLTKREIEDNQLKDVPNVGVLDYAQKWAKDISSAAAYHPQQQLINLILNGKTGLAYDGKTFFAADHPINPNGGGTTYSNIISAVPINAAPATTEVDALVLAQKNFAKALAKVTGQKFNNGVPRYLRPTVAVGPTALEYRLGQITGAGLLAQSDNTITKKGIEVIIDAQFDAEPDVYYIGVEDILADEMGAFFYSERQAFEMTMYGPMTEAALNRMKRFEWDMEGYNMSIYGHPYMFFRCEPT